MLHPSQAMELNLTNAAIYGELLRDCLLDAMPPLIKSRRQLFRSYPNTFVGCEVVDWIIKNTKEHPTQSKIENNNTGLGDIAALSDCMKSEGAVRVMQTLADFGILHSLHGDIPFKNDTSLYRFTTDDGTCCRLVEALVKGSRLYKTTTCRNCTLLQRVCEYGEVVSEKCMRGSDLVLWVIEHGLASHRDDSKRVCRLMFDHKIIKPATESVNEFVDGRPFYLFNVDYSSPAMSTGTFLSLLESGTPIELPNTSSNSKSTRPLHARQLSGQLMNLSVQDAKDGGTRRNTSSSSDGSDDSGYTDTAAIPTVSSYGSLLTSDGKVTPEALAHPNAPFIKKDMRIYPDAVGYGFIIRGSSPCYVKIVDPESPAGKCGLKAWQYITEINDCDVTRKSHTDIEDLILNGPKCLMMTVMLPKDEEGYANIQRLYTNLNKASQPDVQSPKPFGANSNPQRRQSMPVRVRVNRLPSAQPWMKQQRKASDLEAVFGNPSSRFVH